jgi:hypothetical protein
VTIRLIGLAVVLIFSLLVPPRAEAQEAPPRPRGVARVAFLEGGNVGSRLWHATRDGLREQ